MQGCSTELTLWECGNVSGAPEASISSSSRSKKESQQLVHPSPGLPYPLGLGIYVHQAQFSPGLEKGGGVTAETRRQVPQGGTGSEGQDRDSLGQVCGYG